MLRIATILAACWVLCIIDAARGQCTMPPCPSHIVTGQSPDGGTPTQLFTSASLVGQSGHGSGYDPSVIQPIPRIVLNSSYAQPQFGGYSFSPNGLLGIGLDFDAPPCSSNPEPCDPDPQPHNLALAYTNPPVSSFTVYL